MSNLTMKNEAITLANQTPIEVLLQIDEDGTISARRVYGFLGLANGQFTRWAKANILENEFAVENEDYKGFDIVVEGNRIMDYKLAISFAKKLCMKQGNEQGEQARDYFIKVEETHREMRLTLNALSPQLQLLINMEIRQKQQEKEITALGSRVDGIREIVALNPNDWRKESRALVVKIAQSFGGNDFIRDIQHEIFSLVDERARVDLGRRLTNKRQRMALEGVSKSQRDKANKLDIIAEDRKLIEIYIAVVKDMAIRHGINDLAPVEAAI